MYYSSTLANTISALNVAIIARHETVTVPVTNFTLRVLVKLQQVGAISSYSILVDSVGHRQVLIRLAYMHSLPAITKISLVSTNSRIITVTNVKLSRYLRELNGRAVILSTSLGIITATEAVGSHKGGIILLQVEY